MAESEVEQFLSYLSNQRNVAMKTQATALNALVFLYRHIINRSLSLEMNFNKSLVPPKLPVVLTREEMQRLLLAMDPKYKLIAQLLYGSGLRLMEAVRLRVKDVDYDYVSLMILSMDPESKKPVVATTLGSYYLLEYRVWGIQKTR